MQRDLNEREEIMPTTSKHPETIALQGAPTERIARQTLLPSLFIKQQVISLIILSMQAIYLP